MISPETRMALRIARHGIDLAIPTHMAANPALVDKVYQTKTKAQEIHDVELDILKKLLKEIDSLLEIH